MTAEPKELLRLTRLARRHLEDLEQQLAGAAGATRREATATAVARQVQARRRSRAEFLPANLFAEPAWDMLLALYVAQCDGDEAYSYSIFREAGVTPTTGGRFLDKLEAAGLIDRSASTSDRRQILIRLTARAHERMTELLCRMDGRR